MAYTMLKNRISTKGYQQNTLEGAAISFIRNNCEGLRFDKSKATDISMNLDHDGTSVHSGQIPFNMEKDIDRLCLENSIDHFLLSGKKEDAFNVYFCYLEMFIGNYDKTRRMIELLSEFEANGSGLLMKHRDHYSHSVYVFCLGLAIYETNDIYRDTYKKYYKIEDDYEAAYNYLKYWGMTALFHDIGYPFELPYEQVCSYFEVNGEKRKDEPFMAYNAMDSFIKINDNVKKELKIVTGGREFLTTNELFAYVLTSKLGDEYKFSEEQMLTYLNEKPERPDKFGYFMDHAYFSATVLFKKLFEEMQCKLTAEYLDSLTAILMHNSLYKFCISHYKDEGNRPFKAELHPLAYMLMLCDELQCWDRIAYGRNSKKELHPMGCTFDFSDNGIRAVYLYDEKEIGKVNQFKDDYIAWLQKPNKSKNDKAPKQKAYSEMFITNNGVSAFQSDIARIVDLTKIRFSVEIGFTKSVHEGNRSYLSNSNFIDLYNFAMVLNGRWNNSDWKRAKETGQEEKILNNSGVLKKFNESFKGLSLEYKLSNINQAKAFSKYMDRIGCFYTDKAVDFELVEKFTDKELIKIGVLEHQRWLQEHYDMGWVYGTPEKEKRELLRQHKDMIPGAGEVSVVSNEDAKANYDRLDKSEQDKDTDPMECMLAMLKLFDGLRIYRLNQEV